MSEPVHVIYTSGMAKKNVPEPLTPGIEFLSKLLREHGVPHHAERNQLKFRKRDWLLVEALEGAAGLTVAFDVPFGHGGFIRERMTAREAFAVIQGARKVR